jgi:paraquat-inducible protein A
MSDKSVNQALTDTTLVACPNCDLVQRLPEIAPGQSVRCSRCETELWNRKTDSLNRTLALTVAAILLYIIANSIPMLGLTAVGRASFTTIIRGAEILWEHGMHGVSALVFFTVVLAPAVQIGFQLLLLLGAHYERPPAWVGTLLRYLPSTRVWSMLEVILLGVLVALTKIAEYATVIPGEALFSLGALVIVLAAMHSSFDPTEIWQRVEWAHERNKTAAGQMAEVTP